MDWIGTSNKVWLTLIITAGLFVASDIAEAGGFAVREQSVSGSGAAFAGVAAGYDLSSIFWNPAGVSVARTDQAESHNSLIVPDGDITGSAFFEPLGGGSIPLSSLDPNSGDLPSLALVPAMYFGMPVSERLSVGFGLNSPFGLTTKPDNDNWAGKFEARTSKLVTFNLNPVASYKLTERLVVGWGMQLEYIKARLKSAFPGIGGLVGPNPNVAIEADDFAVGYTLGVLWHPTSGTDIGLGFRSSIEHKLEGHILVPGFPVLSSAGVSADLETPEIATASLRQKVGQRVALLGTIEWTNWSNLDEVIIKARSINPNLGAATVGSTIAKLPFNWEDGWFFSGGIEYEVNDRATARAGVAYEESPIQNASQRTPRDPDTNRIWASVGATYDFSSTTSVDLAYSHVFFEDGSIDRTSPIQGLGQVRFSGEAEQDVDIVALSVKIRLGSPPPLMDR
jgi:long-chain fatty acid transport protein